MNQAQSTLEPYYKPGNVFERDEAYYSQMLSGTRRAPNNLLGSRRQASMQRSRSRGDRSRVSPSVHGQQYHQTGSHYHQQSSVQRAGDIYRHSSTYQHGKISPEQAEALEENNRLKAQMDNVLNGSDSFGQSANVVTLRHYSAGGDTSHLRQQQAEIQRLEGILNTNQQRIKTYRNAGDELKVRMNNIQSIDKEIYRTLQGSVNRDRELLDKAASALARGEKREDVAAILQQIITS